MTPDYIQALTLESERLRMQRAWRGVMLWVPVIAAAQGALMWLWVRL